MKSLQFKTGLFFLLMISIGFARANPFKEKKRAPAFFVSQFENVLGTSLELKVKSATNKKAHHAEQIALQEISRLSDILSAYNPDSEFSKWMKTKNIPVKVSDELFEVLALFDLWKIKTAGALNPAAESAAKLWKAASVKKELPSAADLQQSAIVMNQEHWKLDPLNKTATHLTDAPLVLNSFVKSYIIKQAKDKVLAQNDVTSVVLNIGGDIQVAGEMPELIAIADPKADAINEVSLDLIHIKNKSVATSGNYRRGTMLNGNWYSHIIDPRTALPADQIISATVIADNATDAGALATAFNVLSPAERELLSNQFPHIEFLLITKEGKRIESEGWKDYAVKSSLKNSAETKVSMLRDNQWNPDFELIVNLELNRMQGPSRRPFVAVWVEDKDKKSVRTLSVWYNKPRWLRDLRAWTKANAGKFSVEAGNISSVSSATRSAGKYAIKWDGKDDEGNYVKKGEYTVHIEVVREHGTYQLISQEIKLQNKQAQIELPANAEVASASLEYRKKASDE